MPVYNEAENLPHFTQAVQETMRELPYAYQLLFVDDGSTDGSAQLLCRMMERDAHIQVCFLSRNYGHQGALTCGLDHADGDAVITMDGDMQHLPELVPRLLQMWEQGYDVVQTIRKTTKGVSPLKRWSSRCYYRLLNMISDVPVQPGGSDFRLMDRQVVLAFRQYREQDRFIRGLVGAMGFRQTQLPFAAPERFAGHSKFSLRKMVKFAFDGILGNSILPLRLSFYAGLLCLLLSFVLLGHVLYVAQMGVVVPGWATIMVCLSFFGGMQLLVLGILGEYLGRVFRQVKGRPIYFVRQNDRVCRKEGEAL